jgi:hypothetical protein
MKHFFAHAMETCLMSISVPINTDLVLRIAFLLKADAFDFRSLEIRSLHMFLMRHGNAVKTPT